MLSERMLSKVVEACTANYLQLKPCDEAFMPSPNPGQPYMLYMHVPFCERLCPYCSFNRFPFREDRAKPYFQNMRREMRMLKDLGYDFDSVYIGGGTPTIMIDELTLTPKGRYLVVVMMRQFFIGVNNLRDQARAALTGEERELIFGDGKDC